jgi:hypothetical protein
VRYRVRGPFEDIELSSDPFDCWSRGSHPLDHCDEEDAVWWLEHHLDLDFANDSAMRALLAGLGEWSLVSLDRRQVVHAVANALARGRLHVCSGRRKRRNHPALPPTPTPDTPPPPAPIDTSHWVELHVIDDASGTPLAGITLTLGLPGRGTADYTTDQNGLIRVESLEPGHCAVMAVTGSHGPQVCGIA